MEHILVTEHNSTCRTDEKFAGGFFGDQSKRDFCIANAGRFITVVNAKFFIIEYPVCWFPYGNHIDEAEKLVNLMLNKKHGNITEIRAERSQFLDNNFRRIRATGFDMKTIITEIHFTYWDNWKKQFRCIFSEKEFFDTYFNDEEYRNDYKQAKELLTKLGGRECEHKVLDELYYLNDVRDVCRITEQRQIVKSIDELVKIINKKTKTNEKQHRSNN